MILVDANLLIYATVPSMPQHQPARAWFQEILNGNTIVALPWPSLLAYVRLVTNPRVFEKPVSIRTAVEQVSEWLEHPLVRIPQPGERHFEILAECLLQGNVKGNLVPDAHLAAIAIEHGMVLYSTDGDFARFKSMRWENPLTSNAKKRSGTH